MHAPQHPRGPGVTVLCGGLGGARLALAAIESGTDADTTFVTNVADDWTVGGLPVCPDTDAVLYALSGRFDEHRGWGIVGDRFPGPRPGEPPWFGIGELDRVTHERRRDLVDAGADLSTATRSLATDAGITATVLPVTNEPVRTMVRTDAHWREFQEWMVRDHGPRADEVRYRGVGQARATRAVIDAITHARVVVIASSSPVASIAPMLGIAGVRDALVRRSGPTLALSPIVTGRAPATERDLHRDAARRRLLSAAGIDHHPAAVARWLAPLVSHFAIDPTDTPSCDAVAATGAAPVLAPVIGIDADERRQLIALFERVQQSPRSSMCTTAPAR